MEQLESLEERALEAERLAKVWELKCAEMPKQAAGGSSYKAELREIAQRQKLLEATNRQLAVEAQALTAGLGDLSVTEEDYGRISATPLDKRTVTDAAKMKLFETIHPVRCERDKLQRQVDTLSTAYAQEAEAAQSARHDADSAKSELEKIKSDFNRVNSDFTMAQDLIAKNHDKALAFDRTKEQLTQNEQKVLELENSLKIAQRQLEDTTIKYKEIQITHETVKQRENLLEEDKKYLKRQNDELSQRKTELEKINNDLMDRNLRLQAAREQLVEKYLTGADSAREAANNENRNNMIIMKTETEERDNNFITKFSIGQKIFFDFKTFSYQYLQRFSAIFQLSSSFSGF